ncbi:MAG TPA: sulfotransferase domain-containing protein [Candidatus Binatia bacterium]
MIKAWRHNWTSQARRYLRADAIVVSIPKSGRTWLRVFLYAYFCRSVNREFTISNRKLAGTGVPKVMFTHDLWGYVTSRKLKFRLLGKELIPARACRTKPILLLVRDPRDVIVSFFFQITKRGGSYRGDLSGAIRHPGFGVNAMVDVMNAWMAEWSRRSDFKFVRYEDCQSDTEAAFREVLGFLGVGKIDEAVLRHSLEFSSFENMKRMESMRQFKNKILSAANLDDPESYKVRRGIVGGYRDYVAPDDIRYLDHAVSRLDERFGYGPGTRPIAFNTMSSSHLQTN